MPAEPLIVKFGPVVPAPVLLWTCSVWGTAPDETFAAPSWRVAVPPLVRRTSMLPVSPEASVNPIEVPEPANMPFVPSLFDRPIRTPELLPARYAKPPFFVFVYALLALLTLKIVDPPTCKSSSSEPLADAVSVALNFNPVNVVVPLFQVWDRFRTG